jgi:subtilisin-like proprotein convertase family protein
MFKNSHPILRWIGTLTVLLGTVASSFAQNTAGTANDITLSTPTIGTSYTFVGSTLGFADNFTAASSPGSATAQASGDYFFKITTQGCADKITLSTCGTLLTPTTFDTYIHLIDITTGLEVADNDNSTIASCMATATGESGLEFNIVGGRDYYIVVEGAGTASGDFALNVLQEDLTPLVATATANTTAISADVCETNAVAFASTPSGMASYAWTAAVGAFTSSMQNPSIASAATTDSDLYQVLVTDAGGCTATAEVFLNVLAPTVVDAGPDNALCAKSTNSVSFVGTVTNGATATWTHTGGGTLSSATWTGAGESYSPGGADLTGAFPKTITFTLTSAAVGSCPGGVVDAFDLVLYECPNLTTTAAAFCTGGSVDLTTKVTDASAAAGAFTWYDTQANAQTETVAGVLASTTVSTSGTYWVRKNTGTTPVCFDIKSVVVSINALPAASVTASGALSCNTPAVTLTALPATGMTYAWSAGATPVALTNTATVTASGLYTVTVTDATTLCFATADVTVTGSVTPSGPLAGTYFIPSTCFPTIADAAAYFNLNGVSAPVTFEVANTHTETAPAAGITYQYNVAVTGANQTNAGQSITFRRNSGTGAHPLVTAGVGTTLLADAIFRVVGVDYITFDGIDVQESAANVTGTTQAEYGYAFFKASATDGAQNNTVQNCVVTLNRLNTNTIGLYVSGLDAAAAAAVVPTATSGANSYNKFYSNTIQNTLYPIVLSGGNALNDVDNEVGAVGMGNTITNWGGGATFPTNESAGVHNGMQLWQQGNVKVVGNTISGFAGTTGATAVYNIYQAGFSAATPTPNVNITNNTISISATLATSTVVGVYNTTPGTASSANVNITNNSVTASCSMTGGSLQAIFQAGLGFISALNMSNNTVTLLQTNAAAGNTTFMRGVRNANTPALLMNFNDNTMTGCRNASANSGSFRFIDNAAQAGIAGSAAGTINMNGNTLSDMKPAVGNAISLTSQLIFFGNTGATPIRTGTLNMKNNTIQNVRLSTTTASSDFFFFAGGAAGNALNATELSGNVINDVTYTAPKGTATTGQNVTMFLIQSPTASNIVSNNTVTNITLHSGFPGAVAPNGFIGINGGHAGTSGIESVSNNTFDNINLGSVSSAGPAFPIYCTSGLGYVKSCNNNTITNISNATGFVGISSSNGGTATINNNTINTINTGIIGNITGISTIGNTANTISGNTISNLANTNANGQVVGINTGGTVASTQTISKNNIFNLATSGAGGTGLVRGIFLSAGAATVHNNYISGLSTAALSSNSAIIGIQQSSVEAFNAYFNTVALGDLPTAGVAGTALTTSGTNFGGAGIQYIAGSPVNMRNNILYTNIGAKGTGVVSAIRRSTAGTAGTANAGAGSLVLNNNVYYAPSVANSYVYAEGFSSATPPTNTYDFASVGTGCGSTYKAFMNPNESGSYAEITPFLNTGATPLNLQVDGAAVPTSYASNSGVTIAGLTTDYFAVTRTATPDMGAAEFGGASVDLSAPVVTYTAIPAQSCPSALVLNTTITDASGINVTAGTAPRLWYKISTETDVLPATNTSADNGWKYVEGVAGAGVNAFAFTFDYSLLTAPVIAGTTIQYFIAAQDLAGTPNVVTTANMTGCPSTVALATNFPTVSGVSSFLVNGAPTGPFATTSTSAFICGSGNITLGVTPSGAGLTYDWYSSTDGISFTTSLGTSSVPTFAVTGVNATTWYRADLQCLGTSIAGSPASAVQVIVNDPMLLTATATPTAVCGAQPIDLMATASAGATVAWFPSAISNTALTVTTGINIAATTTFYAEAQSTTSVAALGNPNIVTTPTSSIDARINNGQIFSTGNSIGQINSMNIYPAVAGDVVILLLDGSNAVVGSATMAVAGAQVSATAPNAATVPVVMPLNFRIPANSTNWKVVVSSNFTYPAYPNSVTLWRSNAIAPYAYPYSANGLTMSNSTAGSSFMYFYDIKTQAICKSPRQAVTVTYSAPSVATVTPSSSVPFCPGGSTDLVAAGGTYTTFNWSSGQATATITANPLVTTTYTVTASDASCSATASYTVVVLPAPTLTPATATPNAVCVGSASTIAVTATVPAPTITGAAPGVNMALPDSPAPGNSNIITISGAPVGATMTGISVHLKGTHTYMGDVNFTLTCPTATVLDLTPPAGTTNSSDDFNINFSSTATTAWTAAPIVAPPTVLTGNYLPTGGAFSTLYGCPINGNWTITGTDAGGGDFGVLTDWDITINYSVTPAITYAWTGGATTASTSVSPTTNTTYIVTVTNAANGCTATSATSVTVGPPPVAGTGSTLSACASTTATDMNTLIGTHDAGGVWAETSATLSTTGVTAAGLFTTAGNAAGTYTFTYTVAATAPCTVASTATVSITVSAAPSTLVVLPTATGVYTMVESCTDASGWTYYANSMATTQTMFAIKWDPTSVGGAHNMAAKAAAAVTITVDAAMTQVDGTIDRTVTMKRYWNIDPGAGVLDGPVNVKFFYDATEATAAQLQSGSSGTLPGATATQLPSRYEGFKWFKSVGQAFGPSCVLSSSPAGCGILPLVDANATSALVENGILYAQFDGVPSFSGGSGAGGWGPGINPLPVKLLSFTGAINGKVNDLTWKTATEQNVAAFVVERSADGNNFKEVGRVAPTNTSVQHAYNFTDANPTPRAYYRLRMVDNDGTTEFSNTITLLRRTGEFNVAAVYPNPTNGIVNVEYDVTTPTTVNFVVIDVLGRVVVNAKADVNAGFNVQKIDLADFASGVYTIIMDKGTSERVIRKVVKE